MGRGFLRWLVGSPGRTPPPRRRRIRPAGCLLWILGLLVALLVLSLLFGGFQKGTKAGSSRLPASLVVTAVH
jgi:hypothetical protein